MIDNDSPQSYRSPRKLVNYNDTGKYLIYFDFDNIIAIETHRKQINTIVGSSLTSEDLEGLTALGLKNPSEDKLSPYSILRTSRNVDMN